MTTNADAHLAHYKNARAIARRIALDYARVRYTLHFYMEDKNHATVQTGTRFIEVSACVPLLPTTNVKIPMQLGLPSRVALRGGRKEHLICRLTIALVGTGCDSQNECVVTQHECESTDVRWLQTQTRGADEGARVHGRFTVPDLTPQNDVDELAPAKWTIVVCLAECKELQIGQVEFTHDSDEHQALTDALVEEATEANMDTAFRLLQEAKPAFDPSQFVGCGALERAEANGRYVGDLRAPDGGHISTEERQKRKLND
jgi:hypothetical protein